MGPKDGVDGRELAHRGRRRSHRTTPQTAPATTRRGAGREPRRRRVIGRELAHHVQGRGRRTAPETASDATGRGAGRGPRRQKSTGGSWATSGGDRGRDIHQADGGGSYGLSATDFHTVQQDQVRRVSSRTDRPQGRATNNAQAQRRGEWRQRRASYDWHRGGRTSLPGIVVSEPTCRPRPVRAYGERESYGAPGGGARIEAGAAQCPHTADSTCNADSEAATGVVDAWYGWPANLTLPYERVSTWGGKLTPNPGQPRQDQALYPVGESLTGDRG